MTTVSLADAKARLSALVDEASKGGHVCITRHGKPVAKLVPIEQPKKPIDVDALRAFTATLPYQEEDSANLIRRMRDDARY